jgi:multidrug efflux system outer membrane protein
MQIYSGLAFPKIFSEISNAPSSVNANAQTETLRTSTRGFTPYTVTLREGMAGIVFGDLSWELDFFGRIRRATEAARAEFFA